jgi:cytochrome c oxidase subunit 1
MPRRVAYMPYDPALVARWERWNVLILAGGVLMVLSALLLVVNLLLTHRAPAQEGGRELALADALAPVVRVPALLNGFTVWNWLLLALMTLSWAYPIGQFFFIGVHKALPWGFR